MIIKSHVRAGYRSAADYLKAQGENEKIRNVEISDPNAANLDEAFKNMWVVACNSKARKPLHHISINPYKDERLTDAQVLKIVERCEQKYGYKPGEHQRVVVEHIKDGRQHFHVIWNRVSMVTGKAVWPGLHWNKSKQAAREMEKELGLKSPVPRRMKRALAIATRTGGKPKIFGHYQKLQEAIAPNHNRLLVAMSSRPVRVSHTPTSKPEHRPPQRTIKRTRRARNNSARGAISDTPTIKKSYALAAAHSAQWQELSTRYAARSMAAFAEPDDTKRNALLAAIEEQEATERATLVTKQQIETDAELATQGKSLIRQRETPSKPFSKS